MTEKVLPTPLKAWFLATRPKTLTTTLIPVFLGSILAYVSQQELSIGLAVCTLISGLCIQIGTNLINDAIDFARGTDTEKRLGPKRASQSGWLAPQQVLAAGFASLGLAMLFGMPLVFHSGFPLMFLLLVSTVLAYFYTGGPFPLSYHGLGDLFVFLFFGGIITAATYFIQTGSLSLASIIVGCQVGLLATAIIAMNNYRDLFQDREANKKTLAVRFGISFARCEIAFCIMLPFMLNAYWASIGCVYAALLPFLLVPLAFKIIMVISKHTPSAIINQYFGITAGLHLMFGTLLGIGLLLDYSMVI